MAWQGSTTIVHFEVLVRSMLRRSHDSLPVHVESLHFTCVRPVEKSRSPLRASVEADWHGTSERFIEFDPCTSLTAHESSHLASAMEET